MPAKSEKQRRLMAAAAHGADFPMAKKVRASMTKAQLHDYASGTETRTSMHVGRRARPHNPKNPNTWH